MAICFEPRLDILPEAQRKLWPELAPAPRFSFVLYGGTEIALYLGHRTSVDFDFFSAAPLDKTEMRKKFPFLAASATLQDETDTLVVSVGVSAHAVKVSFFGGIDFGRIEDPLQTVDGTLLVASPTDLLATKLKAILDRAQARDYQDIAAMLRNRLSLARGLSAFHALFRGEPAAVLRAIGYFDDISALAADDREILITARDRVRDVPEIAPKSRELAIPLGTCESIRRPFDS